MEWNGDRDRIMRYFFLISLFLHVYFFQYLWNTGRETFSYAGCNLEESPSREFQIQLAKNNPSRNMTDSWSKDGKDSKDKTKKLQMPPDKQDKKMLEDFKKYMENEYSMNTEDSGELLDLLDKSRGLEKHNPISPDQLVPDSGVDKKYIMRERQYKDITVKDVFPTLKTIRSPFEEILRQSEDDLIFFEKRNSIIRDFESYQNGEKFYSPKFRITIKNKPEKSRSPLFFPQNKRIAYLDKTIEESKEDQLQNFIRDFMGYHPQEGDLPVFIRDLYFQNLQRIAYRFSYDPTYFYIDYFQENLNKESFLKNSLHLMSILPGTRSQIELGFSVENIYEIQSNAWDLYFEYRDMNPDLKAKENPPNRIRTLTLLENKYRKLLERENIKNKIQLKKLYFQRRLEIMDFLEKQSPDHYRIADIHYQRGRIYWQQFSDHNNPAYKNKALEEWKKIPSLISREDIFQKEYNELIRILHTSPDNSVEISIRMFFLRDLREKLSEKKERESRLLWNSG